MFTSFIHDHRTHGIPKFCGADVECSVSLAENQIEFQNSIEPANAHFNGRFEIGDNIGKTPMGFPVDYRRVETAEWVADDPFADAVDTFHFS